MAVFFPPIVFCDVKTQKHRTFAPAGVGQLHCQYRGEEGGEGEGFPGFFFGIL